ncbi:biogenesis of lysosome-related organelles complex 1 subunit 1 [Eurytemora carolleeae]|uniref:biogenesis of lysosome-related organelles complex 1 subunit 1 n=1 Tax=Eurytemora carolleeae TaxID=1294199 RepID=UPI000C764519|nr:biogenesis of lysosome-related organelles complex 1 subunit 1 [Eurytemora carolleeae]|eukprot:XP_023326852.1 biogenesis of lysosome-related organelles complex 1 subunit 1-like [Eurytemora affinis]
MLSSLVKEHQVRQGAKKEVQEARKQEALTAANKLTEALVDHLNVGVAQAYLNQKRLDSEAKLLHQSATNFAKQTQSWLTVVESFNTSLKELGDISGWAGAIHQDLRTVASTLEYSAKVDQEHPE